MIPLPHPLVPCTVILPETAELLNVTVILFVFDPAVMLAPDGNVHAYPAAFEIGDTV